MIHSDNCLISQCVWGHGHLCDVGLGGQADHDVQLLQFDVYWVVIFHKEHLHLVLQDLGPAEKHAAGEIQTPRNVTRARGSHVSSWLNCVKQIPYYYLLSSHVVLTRADHDHKTLILPQIKYINIRTNDTHFTQISRFVLEINTNWRKEAIYQKFGIEIFKTVYTEKCILPPF